MAPAPHMSPDDFREQGHALVDWVASYMERVGELPVQAQVAPGDVRALLPAHAPEQGESWDAIVADLDRVVVPGMTNWQSPGWFAFFPANNSGPSILGELVSAGLGAQGMLWSTAPACTELETHMMDWLQEALGLPAAWRSDATGGGVIQDSASSAGICAMVAARHRCGADPDRLVAYASPQTHSSIEKGLRIAGVPADRLRLVDVDDAFAMRPDDLAARMAADRSAGLVPFFCCATVGTTSSLAIDPVRAIGELCRAEGAWLHVDAAMAGVATLCPEHRHLNDGLELADSYCTNAHKWLFTNFDCDLFWVADRVPLIESLTVLPEYLRNAATESGAVIDYRDWQLPLGRRFRAIKLWFVLRHYGLDGLRAALREHVALGAWLADQVERAPDLELTAPPQLGLVCFHHTAGDAATEAMLDRLNADPTIHLTHTRLAGRYTIRVSIGQTGTRREHVEHLWELVSSASPTS